MPAFPPVTHATGEQPPEATLRLLVPIIRSWEYERQFWRSNVFFTAAKYLDASNLLTRACENLFLLHCSLSGIPDEIIYRFRDQCQRNFTLTVLHGALKLLFPGVYAEWRWALVTQFRLYNVLSALAMFQDARPIFSSGLHVGHVDHILMYQATPASPALMTACAITVGSGCALALLHALPPVLPFVPELLLQLVYLFVGVTYHASIAADILSAPKYAAGTQQLCDALSTALPALPTILPSWSPAAPPASNCGAQRAWVLVLFFQLFVGFCLPLYVCYTWERRLKLRFLRQLRYSGTPTNPQQQQQQQQQQMPPGLANPHAPPLRITIAARLRTWKLCLSSALKNLRTPHSQQQPTSTGIAASAPSAAPRSQQLLRSCLLHAAALLLLAAVSWQLVVALQAPLATRVLLLSFQEGYREWYWELMCGTDQPCCPA